MFKWIKKLILNYAVSKAKETITVDSIVDYSCKGVNLIIDKCAVRYIGPEKFSSVCTSISKLGRFLTTLSCIMADGYITKEEAQTLIDQVREIVYNFELSDETIASAIDKLASQLEEKL